MAGGAEIRTRPAGREVGSDPMERSSFREQNTAIAEIKQALSVLFRPGDVIEVRALNTPQGTISGYFNDFDLLAKAAAGLSGKVPAVYVTLNPVNPALLARRANKLVGRVKETTSDADILCRRWLPLDFDPVRPSGISSTDEEHEMALERAKQVREWLRGLGWPDSILADSGNGAHLLYRIDLPNDEHSRHLLEDVLKAIAFHHGDTRVAVDERVFNAARIWKLYGTLSCKGENLPDRPHRLARLLEVPAKVEVVPPVLLEKVAFMQPSTKALVHKGERKKYTPESGFDLEAWIREHNLPVVAQGPWGIGGRKWILNPCPWNPEHTNKAAYIVQFANGAIAAGCHHNGCAGRDWHALRDLYEPGWRGKQLKPERRQKTDAAGKNGTGVKAEPIITRLADVTPEDVEWLWGPYIPRGKLTILEGDPGVGKTWLALTIAAIVSRGWPFPGQDGVPHGQGEPANVLYLSAEDGLADTLRPRLDAAGADVGRVFALTGWRGVDPETGEEQSGAITLAHLPAIEEALQQTQPALVVVDPLQAYLGAGIDMHRANEVRPVLAGLAALAEKHKCAVLCIRHLGKAPQDRAVYRGLGSIDFAAAARSILLVGQDPEDERGRVLAQVKNSLAPLGPSLAFELRDGKLFWCGMSQVTAEALLAPPRSEEEKSALEETVDFLQEALGDGPRPAEEVLKEARKLNIAERTLNRAKAQAGVRVYRVGAAGKRGGGTWYWDLGCQAGKKKSWPSKNAGWQS